MDDYEHENTIGPDYEAIMEKVDALVEGLRKEC